VPATGTAQTTVVLLALVLALDAADRSAVGALAPSLKDAFGIGNTQIGLLAAAFSIVGSLATLPMGVLADRVTRVTLLGVSVAVWSVAMGATGFAISFAMLFATRMALGVLTAAAGPPVSSLIGDLSPVDLRGRVMAWVRTGELVGSGFGFLLSGIVLVLFSWRGVFLAFALVGFVVAVQIARRPEPERGAGDESQPASAHDQRLYDLVEEAHIEPRPRAVLQGSQRDRSLRWALAYTLRIPTILIVIVAGSLGDFFFSGLQVFAVVFAVDEYGISQAGAALLVPVIGAGAAIGLVAGGRLGDALIERGHIAGRIGWRSGRSRSRAR
jgi:MFS family permease